MSRPSKTTRPAVGVNRPVTLLKSVVLPAPFGPISANTSPRLMCRLTLSTATRPPKRLVRLVSSRTFSVGSGTRALLDRRRFFLNRRVLQLLLANAAREQALRAQQHDQDEDQAEDQELQPLYLGIEPGPVAMLRVERAKPDSIADRLGVGRQRRQQGVQDEVDDQRAHYDAGDVAHPA